MSPRAVAATAAWKLEVEWVNSAVADAARESYDSSPTPMQSAPTTPPNAVAAVEKNKV